MTRLKPKPFALVVLLILQAFCSATVMAQTPSLSDFVADKTAMPGYFNLYWDDSTGKMYLEIDELETEFLYQVSMASGLGSNPIGIDRGQLGETRILAPQRVGPRMLLVEKNYRYRAASDNVLEREAVEDAFAPSVI